MVASKLRATMPLLAAAALVWSAASTASADPVSLPGGATGSYALASISCPSAGDCVAVGSYTDSSMNLQGLIETESAGVWTASTVDLSSIPPVADDSNAQLTSVSCAGVGDCVAVGNYYDAKGPEGLIDTERNGNWVASKLSLSSLPSVNGVPGVSLTSVSCPTQGNCTAVGNYVDGPGNQQGLLASESNGTWTASEADVGPIGGAAEPNTALVQVSCASAGDCAAVGNYTDTAGNTLGLIATEWGRTWYVQGPDFSNLPSVAPWGTQTTLLTSVSCPPPAGNCAAVGTYVDATGSLQGMLLNETNGPWAPAAEATLPADADTTGSPPQSDLALNSVSCASAGNCTAVGRYDATSANNVDELELTETGGTWGSGASVSAPLGATANPEASLDSVVCSSPGNCVAAGSDEASDSHNAAVIASQSAGAWSSAAVEQSSSYSYFGINTTSISCATDGYCATAAAAADQLGNTSAFLQDAPGSVQSLKAVGSGRRAATLTWSTPKLDPADPWTEGFTVTIHDLTNPSRDRTITGTSGGRMTFTGLSPGNRYTFTFRYASILGSGIAATSGTVVLGLTRQQIARSLAVLLAPRGPASRLVRLRRTHSYTFIYRPLESGKLVLRWYEITRYNGRRHRDLVASGSALPNGTRAVRVRVRLTAFGRTAVLSLNRLRLTAKATFTSGSTRGTMTRSFTLH